MMKTGPYFALLIIIILSISFSSNSQISSAQETALKVGKQVTNYKENPVGIDSRNPRFSWQLQSTERNVMQGAYQLRVSKSVKDFQSGKNLLWDSGRVISEESLHREYAGAALESGQRYYWQVRVWDTNGKDSGWSEISYFETGLLNPEDWKANWIEPDLQEDNKKSNPSPMLRREFKLNGTIEKARAYVTSHGLYEFHLNGKRVGDQVMTPGWTSYNKQLQYQTYDVTNLLSNGDNAIGVLLGDGWYRGNLGWGGKRNIYGEKLGVLLQLEVTYKNGRKEIITSDQNWKSSTGPILLSEIYHGETYDARLEITGWTTANFDDKQWAGVKPANHSKTILTAQVGPMIRKIEELKPIKIFKTPAGDTVVDFGQNLVGWVRLKVQGQAGNTITIRHAEVLDKAGNFYTENMRAAKTTLRYTLKGGGSEIYEPHFTFFGYRYVAVDGWPGELTTDSLMSVVVHSDLERAGDFETDNALINQLQHNIRWGQKGNFLDVPTDCPQRDERLGWTGDAQVFARTAAFNMNVAGFFTKWLRDLALDQSENGVVPHVIPDVIGGGGSAAWADASVIIPWTMYLSYGDKRFLEAQYESMVKWVEYVRTRAGDDYVWDGDKHYGDWLAFATTRSDYPGATTSKELIATAMYAHSTELLQRSASLLGKKDDAAKYAEQLEKIKAAFCREFVTSTARVGDATQTAYALALQFDLLPEAMRSVAAKRLAAEIQDRKHLTTGFVGTPYLCHVLSRYGYLDEAYMLLKREQYPSWLYPVKQGATTIWERWDGQKPDGSLQDKGMNSFNHYAYGAIGEWMYRVMAGIELDTTAPGYKHILIQPQPGGGFSNVKASHQTMYGKVSSRWALKDGRFELFVEIPANTKATVRLPKAQLSNVTESGQSLRGGRQDGDNVIVEIGSGQYHFAYVIKN